MSRPAMQHLQLNEYLAISERQADSESRSRSSNWWLYDTRAGMNIGMREDSRDEALVKAIEYWAERALQSERCYADLKARVDQFVSNVHDCETCDCED